jgi:hypothetical protein
MRARKRTRRLASVMVVVTVSLLGSEMAHAKEKGKEPSMESKKAPQVKADLLAKFGSGQKGRIERGVDQALAFWRDSDGDFAAYARDHFLGDPKLVDATLDRFDYVVEQLDGHFNEIGRELRRPTDLDVGPLLPVDPALSAYDASAHVIEDLFEARVAFDVLLNFPLTTLDDRLRNGPKYSRREWAEIRLADRFGRRVPAEVQQQIAQAAARADLYIAEYNIWMHHLLSDDGTRLFPKGLRLISHWNLRDELKGDYTDPHGPAKQKQIIQVMERIVTQTIPAAVIGNPRLDWNPNTNVVSLAPAAEIENEAPPLGPTLRADTAPEPDTRYARFLDQYQANRLADPYSPAASTVIARSFELQREIPEERVVAMLKQVLTSPLVPRVAAVIEKRLGRKLEVQDLWYDGFKARGKFSEAELDSITRKRYPSADAFARDIPRILEQLGFAHDKAAFVASHIVVDPARGAGHALQAMRRGDFPHLRTRIEKEGMNYKGYNIAVHELGHNVEQVFSLYEVDHNLLKGVPNTAFTEALAFVFQARDLELLGLAKPDPESERLRVLNDFWSAWEIAGVSLVDVGAWHWMYDHPDATPAQLRVAVVALARDTWNRYYAPVLGAKDTPLLGIYSHMISYPLYLADYPLGHMIAFQIEEQVKKNGNLGPEFERMARFGCVTPDLWMVNATGSPVSPDPLLRAAEQALDTGQPSRPKR